jgi:putative colanic acid biosynthesis acetyltransferase WcaF
MIRSRVRNDLIDYSKTFSRGRPAAVLAIWQLVKWIFFTTTLPWPSPIKVGWLRLFGAKIGRSVLLKPRINIHFPWRLEIGDYTCVGEEVMILNLVEVRIGPHACISQRAMLCTGNHDYRDPEMAYRNAPIVVEAGAWVGAMVFVAPGVTVGTDAVIAAGSVLLRDAEANGRYAGNPARRVGSRWPGPEVGET